MANAASIALHKAVGFEVLDVYRNVGSKNESWHDLGYGTRAKRPRPSRVLRPGPAARRRIVKAPLNAHSSGFQERPGHP